MKIFASYILFTYRNTIGDLDAPVYTYWVEVAKEHPNIAWVMISLIWLFWILNQWILLIIIFNLQIAIIGKTYTDIISDQILHKYQYQSEMNRETRLIMRALGHLHPIDCFILSSSVDPKSNQQGE